MKFTKIKLNRLLILTLAFHISSSEASHDDDEVRILIVGTRGQSRFRAADLLSGRKDSGQEDREIVKTPVITDEGRRMMLVTGPNLCEEDTARQIFTMLYLSSPGPHAVLMVLNLEDQQSQQCDIVQRTQELLGAEVLQYCIVLLIQNDQKCSTGASRGIVGEIINACGGRFHVISDSEPKSTERSALIAEIDNLVWLNDHRFYSVLIQQLQLKRLELLKRLSEIDSKLGENQVSSAMCDTSGVVGWSMFISLIAAILAIEKTDKIIIFLVTLAGLVVFMASLRNTLSPHVAFALNLALCSTVVAAFLKYFTMCKSSNNENDGRIRTEFLFTVGLGITLGSVAGIKSFSDFFIACCAAFGVTIAASDSSLELQKQNIPELFLLFLFCALGAELVMMCVIALTSLIGVMLTIILLITLIIIAAVNLETKMQNDVIELLLPLVFFPCGCVFIASMVLILEMVLNLLKVYIEYYLSLLFYPMLLLASLMLMIQFRKPLMWIKQNTMAQLRDKLSRKTDLRQI